MGIKILGAETNIYVKLGGWNLVYLLGEAGRKKPNAYTVLLENM